MFAKKTFTKKTIRDIDLKDKTVLLRTDYNVPVSGGGIDDDYRIRQSLPTLAYLLDAKARIVVCSHLGRPHGQPDKAYSLRPVAARLAELLGQDVAFTGDCTGARVKKAAAALKPGQILMIENLRFYGGEEQNDAAFATKLVQDTGADVYVQDAFGAVHRQHASIVAVAELLPAVAGLLVEREVEVITGVMTQPERPLMAVVGGAKIADKIDILNRFIEVADFVVVGGAMANTFLLAQGIDIADSLAERNEVPVAKDIIARARDEAARRRFVFSIPMDGVVAADATKTAHTRIVDWSAHVIAEIEHYPKRAPAAAGRVEAHERILDIGPFTGAFIAGGMQLARTVIWNGAMGVTETPGLQGPVGPFAQGTNLLMEAMLGQFGNDPRRRPFSVVGGGDTVGYIAGRGLLDAFDHVSTGGGASLELMAGRLLPGLRVLPEKQ